MRPERAYSPAARASQAPDPSRVLVIGCGALARELVAVIDQAGLANVDVTCLPATLHNRPGGIPAAIRAKIRAARPRYERIFVAYADCGTGGLLDLALADEGVERLPGAHCYEFYSGSDGFAAMSEEDPATFYLTDFLARNFDRLVITGLGLDRHPELMPAYFGNYHRLVYLAQTDDPALVTAARRAARRLGLVFELRQTGYGELATGLVAVAREGTAPAGTRVAGPAAGTMAATSARAASDAAGAMPAAGDSTRAMPAAGTIPAAGDPAAPRPDRPGFAPGGTTVAPGPRIRPGPADSLRAEQEQARQLLVRAVDVPSEHGSRRPTPGPRPMLLPAQRRGGMLRGQQRSGMTVATAPTRRRGTAPTPAPEAT